MNSNNVKVILSYIFQLHPMKFYDFLPPFSAKIFQFACIQ